MRTDMLQGASLALNQMRFATMVASQNINNADNPNYARNVVVFQMDDAGNVSVSPKRMSNFFLTEQLNQSTSDLTYAKNISSVSGSVDKIVTGVVADGEGSSSNPIAQGFQDINASLTAIATDDSHAGRSTLLSRINTLLTTTNSMYSHLEQYNTQIDSELKSGATSLNAQAEQLAKVNGKLRSSPNDPKLVTQRDSIISEMSKQAKLDVYESDNGMVDVKVASGYDLVRGTDASKITTGPDEFGRNTQIYINGDMIRDGEHFGGLLGSNMVIRDEVIAETERSVAHVVVGYMNELNKLNSEGFTSDGAAGGDLVSIPSSKAKARTSNTGGGGLTISVVPGSTSSMSPNAISVEKLASGYKFTDSKTGEEKLVASLPTEVFGFKVEGSGTINVGDKFEMDPLSGMLKGSKLVANEDDIAAAGSTPASDGDKSNLQNIASLSSAKIFSNGDDSTTQALAKVFTDIGNSTVAAEQSLNTAASINENASLRWNNLSGVNTQEEELNMLKYQQIYQSISKVIETDQKMFDSLISTI
ncbi:flagellar hook-associated protein FlgK [Vibrio alginolyticus]|uniref:flagellar hook-associated protein FlgK n=1 Tax=Vibrio alginolyticus TaxID=663 RepID=UPI0006CAA884|nr:flagellar basal body rod C-terminal domain-containing protein [Vibrio alginolyticus]KPM98593.1 hypothetical protein AOG25_09155 [Vibrio alginolyticus]CAH7158151.1 Flagellar hook-associated protein flgK [Vibrio chagasii]CAH7327664.1 Flagellar hook-associated protein flgK [Vibrio chagasii]